MSSKRKFFAAALLVATGAALVAPMAVAGSAPARGKGEASSTFRAFEIALTHVPQIGDVSASVGVVHLDASTLSAPVASVVIEAIRSGGQSAGTFSASSNDAESSQSVTVPFDGPLTSGEISIAELLAMADTDSATAALGALQSELGLGPLGMSASSPRQGIESIADPFGSVSSSGFSVGPFALTVGDLLPPDLLEALPLSVVWDLAKNLPVDAAQQLRSTIRTLRDLADSIEAIETVNAQLDAAEAQLDSIAAGSPALDDALEAVDASEAAVGPAVASVDAAEAQMSIAQAEVDARQAEVDGLVEQRDSLDQQLAACTVPAVCTNLQSQIDGVDAQMATAEVELAGAQTELESAQAALADADAQLQAAEEVLAEAIAALEALLDETSAQLVDLVDELQAELDELLSTLDELLASIPNLSDLISDVVFEIAGTPLFEIGKIEVRSFAQSDAVDGASDVGCKITGARVLGEALPGTSCDAVKQAWSDVESAISGVLDSLPVSNLPQISVEGLHTYALASDGPDAQGFNSSSAGLSALRLAVPSVALIDVTDQLVANVTAEVEALLGTDIPDAELASILDQVTAQLGALPVGDALSGLRTVGVQAAMAEVANHSRFRANKASVAPVPNPHTPPTPGDPNSPQPHAPMPFTGHEVTYWAVMASVLLTVGAMVWHAGRRWESTMEMTPTRVARPASAPVSAAATSAAQAGPIAAAVTGTKATRKSPTKKPSVRAHASAATQRPRAARTVASKPKPKSPKAKSATKRVGTAQAAASTPKKPSARRIVVRKTTVRRPAPRKASAR
ncbi:MAG: hypothetical protein ABR505_09220 [Actinomycetota bacterium]